jgi:hypothetical protein
VKKYIYINLITAGSNDGKILIGDWGEAWKLAAVAAYFKIIFSNFAEEITHILSQYIWQESDARAHTNTHK